MPRSCHSARATTTTSGQGGRASSDTRNSVASTIEAAEEPGQADRDDGVSEKTWDGEYAQIGLASFDDGGVSTFSAREWSSRFRAGIVSSAIVPPVSLFTEAKAIVVSVHDGEAVADVRESNTASGVRRSCIETDAVVGDAHDERVPLDHCRYRDRARRAPSAESVANRVLDERLRRMNRGSRQSTAASSTR